MADRDSDSQEHDVSLKDDMKAVKAQGELNAKLSQGMSNLRQDKTFTVLLHMLLLKLKS